MIWDDLGFATRYTVTPDPDFPGDGEWGAPEVRISVPGSSLEGGPVALIAPHGLPAWLLTASIGPVAGIYGTPDADLLCLFDRFRRVAIIDVRDPGRRRELDLYPVSVAAARDEQLLLIGEWGRVIAWGGDDVAWVSDRLFEDDLHIRRTDNGRIVCRGRNAGDIEPSEVTLDASSGHVIP